MKKIYGNLLKQILEKKIPFEINGFIPFKTKIPVHEKKKANLQIGEKIFQKKVDEKLSFFLCIIPHLRQERFMLEFGWSTQGRFPWNISRPTTSIKEGHPEFLLNECLLDYGDLFHSKQPTALAHIGWDVWKCSVDSDDPNYFEVFIREDSFPVSEELAEHRVSIAVDQFVADVKKDILPFLDERLQYYKNTGV
jgi:hypothetical protein